MAWWRKRAGSEGAKEPKKQKREERSKDLEALRRERPMDRATFLREGMGRLRSLGAVVGGEVLRPLADRVIPQLIRPPGAVEAESFFELCTRCGDCVEACHQDVILIADSRHGLYAGRPYLDVEGYKPCYLCLDPACANACPSGALLPLTQLEIDLGTARILTDECLAWNETECDRCLQACMLPQPAVLVADDGRVVIDLDLCTGCGMCYQACPQSPPAIKIDPKV